MTTTSLYYPPTRAATGRTTRGHHLRRRATPYLFVLPIFVVFTLFYLWPTLVTVASSFFTWGMLRPWQPFDPSGWNFAGLSNYAGTLDDPAFWNAAMNSAVWLIAFPALVLGLSYPLAILIWYAGRAGGLFRGVFILPMTISMAAAGVIWTFFYNPDPDKGVLNALLSVVGLEDASFSVGPLQVHFGHWLSDPGTLHLGVVDVPLVNLFVVVAAVWTFVGFGVITFSAGLTSVPTELLEAARLDGAGRLQLVRHIITPELRPSILVVTVISVIFALRTFDVVFVTTGGGPANDSEVLGMLVWNQTFQYLDTPQGGVAASVAVLMSVAMILLAVPYIRATLREQR